MRFVNIGTRLLALAVLVLATGGCTHSIAADSGDSAKSGPSSGKAVRVAAGHPQRSDVELYTTQPARIVAFEQTPLFSKLTGYVDTVPAEIGDPVTTGQVLLKLRIPELHNDVVQKQALVAQAEAEIKQAEAMLSAAEAVVATRRAGVSLAKAGVGRAEGEYQRWNSEYQRIQELATKGSVTQKLAEEAMNQVQAADASRAEVTARVEAAEAGLHESQAEVLKSQADINAAKASLSVAQANLNHALTLLEYTEIKAPFDGVVTRREVDTGHFVHPASGSTSKPLLVVARTDKVRVLVDIPEMEAPLVDSGETGDMAVIRLQSLRGEEFAAKVTRTSWSLDDTNRSLRAEIDMPNQNGALRPGMYASATILLGQNRAVLTLPVTAIMNDDGRSSYCYCCETGKIVKQPVVLGLRSGDKVEIVSGVDENRMVVLKQPSLLQEGQSVETIGSP